MSQVSPTKGEGRDPRLYHIVTISGKTSFRAKDNAKRLLIYLESHPKTRIEDLAYTTTAHERHHANRQICVAKSINALIWRIRNSRWAQSDLEQGPAPSVIFAFSGKKFEKTGMVTQLYKTVPVFRAMIDKCEQTVQGDFKSFVCLIRGGSLICPINHFSFVQSQLAHIAVEIALVELWKSFGMQPAAVIGQSLGEYGALYAAGVLSSSDCLYLVGRRASLVRSKCVKTPYQILESDASEQCIATLLNPT